MFNNLRNKLKTFRKKAEEELEEVIVAEVARGGVDDAHILDVPFMDVGEDPSPVPEIATPMGGKEDKGEDEGRIQGRESRVSWVGGESEGRIDEEEGEIGDEGKKVRNTWSRFGRKGKMTHRKEKGIGKKDTGIESGEKGIGKKDTGIESGEKGIGKKDTGIESGEKGIPRRETEIESGEKGIGKKDTEKRGKEQKRREKHPGESLLGKKLRSRVLDNILPELEMILMESDVALPVVDQVTAALRDELEGIKVGRREDVGNFIEHALRSAIRNVLTANTIDLVEYVRNHEKPVRLMFVGVNGTGKTTTIAKLVHHLRKNGLTSVIAAADTFRAGAIEQLEVHAGRLGVRLIKHQSGSDPAAVAYDAVEHARARGRDVVLIDTAGRMQTNKNLMNEMIKIKRVARPDMIIFVGDSLAGNDAVEQAYSFNEAVTIDGAILTKIDSDARGGAALSIAHAVGKPILFVGVGQGYDDLEPFSADWMVNRLFGEEEDL